VADALALAVAAVDCSIICCRAAMVVARVAAVKMESAVESVWVSIALAWWYPVAVAVVSNWWSTSAWRKKSVKWVRVWLTASLAFHSQMAGAKRPVLRRVSTPAWTALTSLMGSPPALENSMHVLMLSK
jgi:hypothetical protein